MTKEQATREALKQLVYEMEYVLSCINENEVPFDGDDFHEALRLGKEALANHIEDNLTMVAQQSNEQVEPDYKLMPREATREMLEAMDECSMEGYDERLYAGHAASVYMAAWDAFHGQHCYCGDITTLGVIHRNDGPCHYPEHTTEYKRGYADAMNWKVQNHLEHLPTAQPEQEPTPTPNEGFEGSIRIFLKKSDGQWERLEKLEQVHEYNKQQWTQRTAAVGEDTRRAWVGLTDEEAEAVNFPNPGVCYVYPSDWEEVGLPFVRAIEAKLKAKNERLEKNK